MPKIDSFCIYATYLNGFIQLYITFNIYFKTYSLGHIIQLCSEITSGRVLSGELYAQIFTEVNLPAFVYRLFHEDLILFQ